MIRFTKDTRLTQVCKREKGVVEAIAKSAVKYRGVVGMIKVMTISISLTLTKTENEINTGNDQWLICMYPI